MNIEIVACLPKRPSFLAALVDSLISAIDSKAHSIKVHDLYAEQFDPVLSAGELARGYSLDEAIQDHCADIAAAELIVIVHPDWWGQPPALLKGWVDRVFRQGIAYDLVGNDQGEKVWTPLFTGKKALVFAASDYASGQGMPIVRDFWTSAVFGACGAQCRCEVFENLRTSNPEARKNWIAACAAALRDSALQQAAD